jgi:Gas vesicle synthesis protein GvpL/GvpF
VIYLYAIAEELDGLPDVRGIDGAALDRRSVAGLDLVVSEHDGTEVSASEEAVLAHARVVEALVERSAALLPARFGRGFRDEAGLRKAIEGRAASLRDALAQVRGCVEVGVRVLAAEAAAPPAAESGRAYMEARLARSEETERLARALHEPLAALARAATRTVGATPRLLLSGAYLVEPGGLDAFRRRVEELEAAHPELTFVSTGPWPPYSFAPGGEG